MRIGCCPQRWGLEDVGWRVLLPDLQKGGERVRGGLEEMLEMLTGGFTSDKVTSRGGDGLGVAEIC